MNEESWRWIAGFPGYEISTQGRIRSWRKQVGVSGEHHRRHEWIIMGVPQRILKGGTHTRGYPNITLWKDGRGYTRTVHRLILLTFVGPCPPGHEACHKDGIPSHTYLGNLEWGTKSKNALDKVRHGQMPDHRGMRSPTAKLTDDQVREIRRLHGVCSQACIGKIFGISQQHAGDIIHRRRWGHLL